MLKKQLVCSYNDWLNCDKSNRDNICTHYEEYRKLKSEYYKRLYVELRDKYKTEFRIVNRRISRLAKPNVYEYSFENDLKEYKKLLNTFCENFYNTFEYYGYTSDEVSFENYITITEEHLKNAGLIPNFMKTSLLFYIKDNKVLYSKYSDIFGGDIDCFLKEESKVVGDFAKALRGVDVNANYIYASHYAIHTTKFIESTYNDYLIRYYRFIGKK